MLKQRVKKWDKWTVLGTIYILLGFVYVLHGNLGIPDNLATLLGGVLLIGGLFFGVLFYAL